MDLYVWNSDLSTTVPVEVTPATPEDLKNTSDWQTQWTSKAARAMPNKVALRRKDTDELL